jgi:hypothetical protein
VALGDPPDVLVSSTTGAKESCNLAPILFSVYMQAVVEDLDARLKKAGLLNHPYFTTHDFVIRARKHDF